MEEKVYNIGVEATMDVIGGKWKPIILCNLRYSSLRPSDLQRKIPSISQKMLTQQLRELEKDQIVVRTVYQQVPPKVEYSLSEYGSSLAEVLDVLCNWGELHVNHLRKQGKNVTLRCNGKEKKYLI
ncbi:MAG TPA: MarR family transcriptional regulator [Lachnospiraceae bacterium]|nr:MarR family transcriptional regulator [Lachnospiraceae bacterium]HIS61447.1 helix-turn-helix transcriptional regulator [Candidatus Scybalomonas excrementigallinarum]